LNVVYCCLLTQCHSKRRATIEQQITSNFLIVGAGLAGCLLSWRLQEAGQRVYLVGDSQGPNASMVAAGVINPVTGRWAVKSWHIDALLPKAHELYRALEKQFDEPLLHPIPLRRFCQNEADVKRIGRRLRNPRYADVLKRYNEAGSGPCGIRDEFGSFDIERAAYVDLPQLLNRLRKHFNCADQHFEHANLRRQNGAWHYNGIVAEQVIFCEGTAIRYNPWFKHLPLIPIKGETLRLSNESIDLPRALYHHKKWLLPYMDGTFRLGATYEEQFADSEPSDTGKQALLDGLAGFIAKPEQFQILQHLSGLRPATPDARPLLGRHPSEQGLWLFNGLGSKGASVAPLYSQHLVDHILTQQPLDHEVDLHRFL